MLNNSVIIKKKTRKAICLNVKIEILDRLATGQGSTSVGKDFGLAEATVRAIKKNEIAIRKSVETGTNLSAKKSSYTRNIIMEKMEKELVIWIKNNSQEKIPLDGNTIKQAALRIYNQFKELESLTSERKYEFCASTGWLKRFLQRHSPFNINIKEEIGSVDEPFANELPKLVKIMDGCGYTVDLKKNIVNDKEALTAGLIKKGLQLASKLEDHFLIHDPIVERAGQFQRDLKACMKHYQKLYDDVVTKTTSQRLITDYFAKTSTSQETNSDFLKMHSSQSYYLLPDFVIHELN